LVKFSENSQSKINKQTKSAIYGTVHAIKEAGGLAEKKSSENNRAGSRAVLAPSGGKW
jgi:hypothetical protein